MKTETHFEPEAAVGGARVAALAAALAVLGLLAAFWPTAVSIEAIWRRAETFAHGYVVVPIVLWLVWRKRDVLARLPVQPCWPALAVVAAAGCAWMLGHLAGVLGLEQFALYFMLVGALVAVLGLPIAREIAFPLAFLAFAVPFGEFLVPVLIDRTADFTIAAIRASGVPVYREGNHFAIPSGRWSVVEACSGIRYLIASMMVGALYAHLTYRTARKRAAFFAVSIVVPIVANWMRAYLIVMLGHLTNNRLAAGVDHIIYGWIFFGLVMMAMFWIGAYWRDDEAPRAAATLRWAPVTLAPPRLTGPVALALGLALALGIAWRPITAAVDARSQVAAAPLPPIAGAAGWRAVPGPQPAWTPHYLDAQSQRHQWFEKDGRTVGVFVALYSAQAQGRELIVSRNELVTPKDDHWVKVDEGRAPLRWGADDVTARTALISGGGAFVDARAWYWVNGRFTASDAVAKALLGLAKVSLAPDHSAVIVIHTRQPDAKSRDAAALESFAREMSAPVMAALRRATGE
ncbi:MAG: exosortase A [Burkholderiales bacterium]